jgi:signal transduction histidine kinase
MLWLAPTLLGLALLFAWGAARSVRRPLAQLTRSAERIASGDLDQPIPRLPEDEVGRLGRSLEHMRVALKASLEEIAAANQALEERVESRTRELRTLYSQLQERDKWREELLRKVISAQEDERRRLARELHDETSQTLSALSMKIETALAAWPEPASRDRLTEARALNMRTLEELHRLIFDLRPSVLDDLGLLSAIRWYAERHLEPLGIAVQFEASGFDRRLMPELETALFRVAQEAITNIAKHANADTVLIQCLERDGRVVIEIEDDGKGFSPASLPPPAARERGLGLLGMRERVELFGGTIEIDSAPGRGTRIAVGVPAVLEGVDAQNTSADSR